jgi:proton-coupled amino acid transporter
VQVREHVGHGSFGDLARETLGPFGVLIDVSVCFSQFGYCTALALFTAKVFSRVFSLSITVCLAAQLLPLGPLCCIRKVKILAIPALFADVLILVGLVAVAIVAARQLVNHGISGDIVAVGPQSSIFLGTAIYSFEGIGNIMPIYNSMREKDHFCNVFVGCMIGITSLFVGFALTGYLAYGSKMQTVAVFILPSSTVGCSIQIAYAVAVALSFPLVLFPASKICADLVFRYPRQPSFLQKMAKNIFLICLVCIVLLVSWVGQDNLDHLVAFIGSFCCVPLGLLYPPWMHLRAFPNQSIMSKIVKYMEIGLGLFCMVFTSYNALATF